MGCSPSVLTSSAANSFTPTALVVAADGSLLVYCGGVAAADVLAAAGSGCVLCNSDKLFFDAYPPAVSPDEELEPGQIYFLLSEAVLRQRLSGVTVAALALRANSAMKMATERKGRRRMMRVGQVAGVFDPETGGAGENLEWRLPSRRLGGC